MIYYHKTVGQNEHYGGERLADIEHYEGKDQCSQL
jgi:hypothetical protein